MTNHAIADELFRDEYKDIRAAYREGAGNATIRAECQREVSASQFLFFVFNLLLFFFLSSRPKG